MGPERGGHRDPGPPGRLTRPVAAGASWPAGGDGVGAGEAVPLGPGGAELALAGSRFSNAAPPAGTNARTKASISSSSTVSLEVTASSAPTGYACPGSAISRTKRVSYSTSTSLTILSVSICAMTCPLTTDSPTLTFHSLMVPSTISMPHLGIVNARNLLTVSLLKN